MKYICTAMFLALGFMLYAQEDFNIELLARVEYPEPGNDIWGWVDEDGTEYAIVGTTDNTRIYNLAEPTAPREVIAIPGQNSIWRDMKSWEDHVYVTTDNTTDGLLVIDMSEIATDSVRYQYLRPELTSTTGRTETLGACHNIYIDENGFAYLAGCSPGAVNKAVIFDLNEDKWTPTVVGVHGDGTDDTYSHDLFVRDNIMYSSEIYVGKMVIWDVSDKSEIQFLGEAPTSFDFTHNIWLSDDSQYAFTTDERNNAFVDSYDISDFNNIKRLDKFQPLETAGNNVVPHNTHFIDNYLVTSWYTDGIVITDVTRPDNIVKVGAYDTYPFADGETEGCWGAYPWLPSGLILANDRTTGFHVLQPQYTRACFLEGTVTSAVDGSPINNVDIEIVTDELYGDLSSLADGSFSSGLARPGTFTVRFYNNQYQTLEVEAELINGEVTILDVQMEKRPIVVSGQIIDADSGNPLSNGVVRVMTDNDDFEVKADFDGQFSYCANQEEQRLFVGSWGHKLEQLTFVASDEELVIELEAGYEDDFVLDLGWVVDGDQEVGVWVRDVPIETRGNGDVVNIGQDVDGDVGEEAYITGNGGLEAGTDDVDAINILRTPPMLLGDYADPQIQFRAYFYNCCYFFPNSPFTNGPENDSLKITISDGTNLVSFMTISETTNGWTDTISMNVMELGLDTKSPIIMSFTAKDDEQGHWVEAGIDAFRVVGRQPSATTELVDLEKIQIFPNPTDDWLNINTEIEGLQTIKIYDTHGKIVLKQPFENKIDVSELGSAPYLLVFAKKNGDLLSSMFVKK